MSVKLAYREQLSSLSTFSGAVEALRQKESDRPTAKDTVELLALASYEKLIPQDADRPLAVPPANMSANLEVGA